LVQQISHISLESLHGLPIVTVVGAANLRGAINQNKSRTMKHNGFVTLAALRRGQGLMESILDQPGNLIFITGQK
jgi:hypothetical protein